MIFADMPLALRSVKSFTDVPFGILPNSRSSSRCSEAPLAGFHATANAIKARMMFELRRRMAESCPARRRTQTERGGRREEGSEEDAVLLAGAQVAGWVSFSPIGAPRLLTAHPNSLLWHKVLDLIEMCVKIRLRRANGQALMGILWRFKWQWN